MLTALLQRLNHLPRDSRDTLFLLAVIGWVLLPQTQNLPWWCSALAFGVLAWRARLALSAQALPSAWWRLGLLALAMAATLLTFKTLLGRDAGVTMLAVLLTLKTLELRARRDAFVVFFLGFFCMLANFFYSQSLVTAAGMLIGLLGLLTVLVNAHMPVGKPPLLVAAKTASWMALLGAPIMVVLFLLFPRLAPLWGTPGEAIAGRSGLSGTMQVGSIASLAQDDSVALRIKFEGPAPQQPDLYFRGPVLSTFDGREWRAANPDVFSRFKVTASLVVSGPPVRYEVTQEPSSKPWLVVMDAAVKAPVIEGYDSLMQSDLQWITNRPINSLVRYKVESYTRFAHGPTQPVVGLKEFVDLPPGFNPRTAALAADIRRDPRYAHAAAGPLVDVAMTRLRTGRYTYTLEPGLYGPNTADEFWFDKKEGFCEHIASSFVILMRALGVPARIVTGYQGGELNGVDNFWTVRQSDAHAWAEVWFDSRGWVRVDPTSAVSPGRTGAFQRLTPPQNAVGQALRNFNPAFSMQLRAAWEAVNNSWNQWVLNYTQGQQLNLLKNIGFTSPSWEDLSYVLIGIVVLVSVLGAAWGLWERTQHDPWLRLLSRARKRLAAAGIASSPASTPRQLALLLRSHLAESDARSPQSEPIDWLMRLEAQRYSAVAGPGSPALAQLSRQFKGLAWPK